MATQLSITNRVLKRLRETTVPTVNESEYSALVADFVADTYEEVAQTWDWQAMRHTVKVTLLAGQTSYDLSTFVINGGDVDDTSTRLGKPDSIIVMDSNSGREMVFIYDDDADTSGYSPIVISKEQLNWQMSIDRDADEDDVSLVSFSVDETGTKLIMDVWPRPTAASRKLEVRLQTEPDRLADDGSDENVALILPERPIYQLALMYAYNERGEEIGEPGNLAEARALDAIQQAMDSDLNQRQKANEYDWRRD